MSGEPKFVEMGPLTLVGLVSDRGQIGALWGRFMKMDKGDWGTGAEVGYELHIHPKEADDKDHFYCMVAVAGTDAGNLPAEVFVKTLPARRYVVFTHKFADGDYAAAYRKMREWVKSHDVAVDPAFDLQVYDERFKGNENPDSEVDIYLPVT